MVSINKYYKISKIVLIVSVTIELIFSALSSQVHNSIINSISLLLSLPMMIAIFNYIVIIGIKYKKEKDFYREQKIQKPSMSYLKISALLLCGNVGISMLFIFVGGLIPFINNISLFISMLNFPLFVNLVVAAIVTFITYIFNGTRIIILPWRWW